MEKNLFTFNFRKFLRAEVIAILFILLSEISSWFILINIRKVSRGGDLIEMDSDFFNRNFRKYATDPPRDIKYTPKAYNSWKECWAEAPYAVIVVGDSSGSTGWAEMLQPYYGLKTLNTTGTPTLHGDIFSRFCSVMGNYNNINKNTKTVLLGVCITARANWDFKYKLNIRKVIKKSEGEDIRQKSASPFIKVTTYFLEKIKSIKNPIAEVININGRAELFWSDDIEGLTKDISYSADEFLQLRNQLKRMKDIAAEKKCIYAIIAFPTKPQQYEWLLIKSGRLNAVSKRTNLHILKEACRENNIPFLDIEERIAPIAKSVFLKTGKLLWYRCDSHMNGLGAYYSAKIINSFLSEISKEQ